MPADPADTPAAAERDDRFPSTTWGGFYQQRGDRPTSQDMHFRGGRLSGGGRDPAGRFTLSGAYDTARGTAAWTKRYPSHAVRYRGFAEDGSLWGTWELPCGRDGGGFRIWPDKRGAGDDAATRREGRPDVRAGDADPLADLFGGSLAEEEELVPIGVR